MLTICSICCFLVCSSCQTGINNSFENKQPRKCQSNRFKPGGQVTQWPVTVPFPCELGGIWDRQEWRTEDRQSQWLEVTANTGHLDNGLPWRLLECRWFQGDVTWKLCMDPFGFRKHGKLEMNRQASEGFPTLSREIDHNEEISATLKVSKVQMKMTL